MLKRVWVLSCETESGDEYGPWVFAYKPEPDECQDVMKRNLAEEYEYISYVKLSYSVPVMYA